MLNRFIKFTISVIFYIFNKIYFYIIKSPLSNKSADTLVILSYHSVKPQQRERFAQQMDRLVQVGKPVLADMVKNSGKGVHHIAVTFDDGFKSVIDNALPAMLARKIPVTLFVPTGYLGALPGWIKNLHHENAREILITANELKSLPGEMVRIGSHCVSHPRLTSLKKEQIQWELSESKKQLEMLLGRNVSTLSFPHDNYNHEIVELAREAGYSRVFKDLPTYPISKMDGFLFGRITASPEDWGVEYFL
jgi:peptidoglycan/xylan/chitin deacetylase (PgdA/CDA1 family)